MPPELTPQSQAVSLMSRLFAALRGVSLLRTAAGSLGLKMGAAGLGFINGILLARLLGPAEFGVYSIVFSAVNVGATLAVLGLPMLVTREVAASAEHGQWNKLKGTLSSSHRWTFAASFTLLAITAMVIAADIIKPGVSWAVIGLGMLLVPLIAFNQLRAAILRGLHWVILADIPELLLRPLVLFAILGGAYLTSANVNAGHALGIQLAAVVLSLALGTWWLVTLQPDKLKTAAPETPGHAWLLQSLPFLGIAVVTMLEGQVSLYMLGYLAGAEQAGLFFAANQLVSLIVIGLVAVNMPLQPRVAAAWSRGDKIKVQRLVTEAARLGTGIALVGALAMLFFPEIILHLYGSQFAEASGALRILAVGQIFNAAAGSCGVLLMMTGHQRVVMQGTAAAMLLNLSIASVFIPGFGVDGGALAAVVGIVLWNFYFIIYSLKKLGVNTTIFTFR
jgi:O-antigen/teichoic acid export membrane protein